MQRQSKAWIFVSHSTKDLDGVRRLRDELERRGAEPLLFFLKAIESEPELRTLLRREIEARNFFLLCESEASRQSRWVREEHEHVRQLTGKRVTTIVLDTPWQQQVVAIDAMLEQATAYLSFAQSDWLRVKPYADLLAAHDLAVWTDDQLGAGENFQETMDTAISSAAKNGYLLAFLSQDALTSRWVAWEIDRFRGATGSSERLIPIALDPPVAHLLPPALGRLQMLPFFRNDLPANCRMLLQALSLS